MALKLKTHIIKDWLKKNERSMGWLARKIGVSPEVMKYQLDNELIKYADKITYAIGHNNPSELIDHI